MCMSHVSRKLNITWKSGYDIILRCNEEGIVKIHRKDKKSKIVSLTEKGSLLKEKIGDILTLMGSKSEDLQFVNPESNIL